MKQCALLVRLIARIGKRQIGGQNAIHYITALHICDPEETQTEKRGHHQQHRAQRHFHSDQPFARPLLRRGLGWPSASRIEGRRQAPPELRGLPATSRKQPRSRQIRRKRIAAR